MKWIESLGVNEESAGRVETSLMPRRTIFEVPSKYPSDKLEE